MFSADGRPSFASMSTAGPALRKGIPRLLNKLLCAVFFPCFDGLNCSKLAVQAVSAKQDVSEYINACENGPKPEICIKGTSPDDDELKDHIGDDKKTEA